MKLSPAALETMGECAGDGISPYVWGPALINAAQQIKRLEADNRAIMEVVRAVYPRRYSSGIDYMVDALSAHIKEEASK